MEQTLSKSNETEEIGRWGLNLDEIEKLPERLIDFHERYCGLMKTKTRDTSEYGYHYLSGLLRMEQKRTINEIARVAGVAEQNMQQFMSDSPWSGVGLTEQLRTDIGQCQQFQTGSVLLIDESANERAGDHSAGAGRQYNGRLGKVEMSQVGVFLSLSNNGYHSWVDGELYFPEHWFSPAYKSRRERIGLPDERVFQTKLELALLMVKRVAQGGLPFAAIDCDSLYGRAGWLRDEFEQAGFEYYADVPDNTQVYLKRPKVHWPLTKKGEPVKKPRIVGRAYTVRSLKAHPKTRWQRITLRPNERGMLKANFARRYIWTVRDAGTVHQEWLLIRKDTTRTTYALSNAAKNITLTTMAHRKSQRYFIERSNQEAKSDFGWDEFQALKYRAWQHQLALTIMASWFVTQTRLDWAERYDRDPLLLKRYQTDVLPALSVANVRTLLRATLPLPALTPAQAASLVIKHLDNRSRSRQSRLNHARSPDL